MCLQLSFDCSIVICYFEFNSVSSQDDLLFFFLLQWTLLIRGQDLLRLVQGNFEGQHNRSISKQRNKLQNQLPANIVKIISLLILMCYHVTFYEKITFFGWLRALLVSLQQRPLLTLQSLLVRQSSPEIGNIRFHSLIYHYTNENNTKMTYLMFNLQNIHFSNVNAKLRIFF